MGQEFIFLSLNYLIIEKILAKYCFFCLERTLFIFEKFLIEFNIFEKKIQKFIREK